ncbi:MAG: 1-acyl-sn-glycerol-3-phosphate acyltransferase [Spirochaetes bacterium]|nr:1-acyl-sn-glycerol-3-phosphate acyltransferase [Spirochaetota bacterium]MBU0955278.1 1-acyl-sn-glycerol-3-phosphate acyltransferase [Spirochaetota bacterium]
MIRTILFFMYFWLAVTALTPLGLLLLIFEWLHLRFISRPVMGFIVRVWARSVIFLTGTKAVVNGLENVPKEKAIVFVSNHQGDMDFVMNLAFLPRLSGFMIKSQAAFLPFINIWIAAIGCVFLNRDSLAKGKKSIEVGVRKIKGGQALCIYPEGTRSRGVNMGPFRNGSFKLATMADATIVPITVHGSWLTWEAHKRIMPATIQYTLHPPVPTAGLSADERRALPDRIKAIIQSALPAEDVPQ